MHPLINDLTSLKDAELDSKINELTRKYFASHNPALQQQVIMVLESYKEELARRQLAAYEKMVSSRNKDLDKLINVS